MSTRRADIHGLPRCPRRARRPLKASAPRPSTLLVAFFAPGLAMMLAGAAAAIVHAAGGGWWLHWVSLHLVFLGGISQLVLGAGQFFVCAFLATDPPPRRLIAAELASWNAGTLLVAAGEPTGTNTLTLAGAGLILIGLALFAAALAAMRRRSLQRARWALRWYQASAACLALGAVLGTLMARGTPWTHGSLLGAHLALNLGGWFGTAIIGTLHTFFPSLTQTPLRHPRLQGPTFLLWMLAVAELALGSAFGSGGLLASGWLDALIAAVLLSANVLGSLRAAPRPLSLPARLVAVAHAFFPAGLLLALVTTVQSGSMGPFAGTARAPLATLLVGGWIGLTVAGSLLHLLAVLARVRDLRRAFPAPRPRRDRSLTALAATAVTALALSRVPSLAELAGPARVALLAAGGILTGQVLLLATRAFVRPMS
ncbi:MAG: hypothetical protein ACXVFN_22545 [Solirubrobacteraceae bacterium]